MALAEPHTRQPGQGHPSDSAPIPRLPHAVYLRMFTRHPHRANGAAVLRTPFSCRSHWLFSALFQRQRPGANPGVRAGERRAAGRLASGGHGAVHAAQSAGNLNVVVVGWHDATAQVQSVTDTNGHIYTRAVGPTVDAGVATQSIYYAANIGAAAAGANIVTVTFTAAATYPDVRVAEYAGLAL